MKLLIFGATGMVGQGALRESLVAPDVSHVTAVGRSLVELAHPKLKQLVQADLMGWRVLVMSCRVLTPASSA